MARYDLQATFDLIRKVSGKKKVFYIGDKIGATALLAYGSLFPEKIKEKVFAAALFTPIAERRNSGTIISRLIGRHPEFIWKWKELFGIDKFLSYHAYQKPFIKIISDHGILMFLFIKILELMYGFDKGITAVKFF